MLDTTKFDWTYFLCHSCSIRKAEAQKVGYDESSKLLENIGATFNIILMAEEMYLQKGEQYVGANGNGNLYKSVMVFMISSLKNFV